MDELAYKSGIDPNIPNKGPNYDKEFMQSVERAEFSRTQEGRLQRAEVLSSCMDKSEVQRGHFLSDADRRRHATGQSEIITQGKYRNQRNQQNTSTTTGTFIGTIDDDLNDKIDRKYQNSDDSADDDDLFQDDDDDEDFKRQLESIRQRRLLELKQQDNTENNAGTSSSTATTGATAVASQGQGQVETQYPPLGLEVKNSVKEIVPEQFTELVMNGSQHGVVIMLVYKPKNRASDILLHCINVLSKRLPHIHFYVIALSPALSHVPENHCPLLMCYDQSRVVGSFPQLAEFRGSATGPLDVEWKLAQCGIIDSSLQEDPRDSDLFVE